MAFVALVTHDTRGSPRNLKSIDKFTLLFQKQISGSDI